MSKHYELRGHHLMALRNFMEDGPQETGCHGPEFEQACNAVYASIFGETSDITITDKPDCLCYSMGDQPCPRRRDEMKGCLFEKDGIRQFMSDESCARQDRMYAEFFGFEVGRTYTWEEFKELLFDNATREKLKRFWKEKIKPIWNELNDYSK